MKPNKKIKNIKRNNNCNLKISRLINQKKQKEKKTKFERNVLKKQ